MSCNSAGVSLQYQPMDIALFRPSLHGNLNDTLIEWGTRVLLHDLLGPDIRFHQVHFETPDALSIRMPRHDLFIVCGTPWIWDHCTGSKKYNELMHRLAESTAPKIAMGLGACFPMGFSCRTQEAASIHLPGLSEVLRSFTAIAVRDSDAQKACEAIGIRSKLLICPAVFAPQYKTFIPTLRKRDVLFYYGPQFGLSRSVLSKEFVQRYNDLQLNYARHCDARIVCIRNEEFDFLKEQGFDAELLTSTEAVAQLLATETATLLSGRVHSCVYAAPLKIPSALLPVDSRYLTYSQCGGLSIDVFSSPEIQKKHLRQCRMIPWWQQAKWRHFLRCALGKAGLY